MRRPRVSLVINALAACVAIAIAVSGTGRGHDGTAYELVDASGALSLSNSREGAAILSAGALRPGGATSGTVTIGNRGGTPALLALEAAVENEAPGPGGGRLSERLQLTVADEGGTVLYSGGVAGLNRLAAGTLASAGRRTYAITATVPADTGNAYQGAQVALRFTWSAAAPEPAAAPPSPSPTAPPTTSPPPAPATTPAADPNTTVGADQIVPLPPAKTCLGTSLMVRIKTPRGVKVKRVQLMVNGRHAKSKKQTLTVNLRGLRAPYKVKVSTRLANGRLLKSTRTYKACSPAKRTVRPGGSKRAGARSR
jgi:hypothetical protein